MKRLKDADRNVTEPKKTIGGNSVEIYLQRSSTYRQQRERAETSLKRKRITHLPSKIGQCIISGMVNNNNNLTAHRKMASNMSEYNIWEQLAPPKPT